ncbi:hypothetical protein D3C81_1618700 [compost metagenome]
MAKTDFSSLEKTASRALAPSGMAMSTRRRLPVPAMLTLPRAVRMMRSSLPDSCTFERVSSGERIWRARCWSKSDTRLIGNGGESVPAARSST